MNDVTVVVLAGTAASIGLIHTLTGPDHYVPFVAMSRVGRWSFLKTMVITSLCGMGHVVSSVVLGVLGISLGLAAGKLEWFEGMRGNVAGWLLLGFGLAYMVWGIRRAVRNTPHSHPHAHENGSAHTHSHTHVDGHAHVHRDDARAGSMTPWILFTIFVFGPCEPLIPILMYPAAKLSFRGVALVTLVFAVVTIGTMLTLVAAGYLGLARFSLRGLEKYAHATAGLAITLCGAAVQLGF